MICGYQYKTLLESKGEEFFEWSEQHGSMV